MAGSISGSFTVDQFIKKTFFLSGRQCFVLFKHCLEIRKFQKQFFMDWFNFTRSNFNGVLTFIEKIQAKENTNQGRSIICSRSVMLVDLL